MIRAPVTPEPKAEGGGERYRCTVCGKVAKETREEAEAAAARIYQARQYPMKVYFSRSCGWWHLATDRDALETGAWLEHSQSRSSEMATKEVTRYDERFAEMADAYADAEKVTGDFISVKGGVLSVDDEPLPGNQMCVIILDAVKERTYYTQRYDATSEFNLPPVCYAFARAGEDEDEMGPHPSMQSAPHYFEPQSDVCRDCPHNEWGTSDTGRGKACGERRRLAVIPAGYYEQKPRSRDLDLYMIEDLDHYRTVDIGYLKIPVTSVKDWGRFVATTRAQYRRPPFGVITRVYVEPDTKSQFRVKFEVLDLVPDELAEIVFQRYEEAAANIIFPYSAPSQDTLDEAGEARKRRSARR